MNRAGWIVLIIVIAAVALFFGSRMIGTKTENEVPAFQTFTGVITGIDSSELNEVSAFEVRHDGTTTTVHVREDFDYGFPIGHLHAHLTSGDPVTVSGEIVEGKLYADSIEDA